MGVVGLYDSSGIKTSFIVKDWIIRCFNMENLNGLQNNIIVWRLKCLIQNCQVKTATTIDQLSFGTCTGFSNIIILGEVSSFLYLFHSKMIENPLCNVIIFKEAIDCILTDSDRAWRSILGMPVELSPFDEYFYHSPFSSKQLDEMTIGSAD